MGLLDEAIRDHLELKRRRGADPSEIARAEQEALEPVFPPEDDAPNGHPVAEQPLDTALDGTEPFDASPEPAAWERVADDYAPEHAAPDGALAGQDTAEIDMQAVLEEADGVESHAPRPAAVAPEPAAEEELLEWETPARAVHENPVADGAFAALDGEAAPNGVDDQIPGQERISFE